MTCVLDSSAVLAVIFEESGEEVVLAAAKGSLLSTVNVDEVLHKSARRGVEVTGIEAQLARLEIAIVPFDLAQAKIAAALHPRLHRLGISFADRACIALALTERRPILTTDGDWAGLGLDLDIRLIR